MTRNTMFPILLMAACGGCDEEIPRYEQLAPPPAAEMRCGDLPRAQGLGLRFYDRRLESEIGDGTCLPMATADGWRCLPEWPVWDTRGTLQPVADGDSSGMDFPDLKPLPAYVLQMERGADGWKTHRAYLVREGTQVCNPLGCRLLIPQPLPLLRVSLLSFQGCE